MSKATKISLIVACSIIAALVITIITLACVQSTYYSPLTVKADYLRLWYSGEEYDRVGICCNPDFNNSSITGNEIYTKVVELDAISRKESVLTGVMGGANNFEASVSKTETTIGAIKNNDIVVEFSFEESKILIFNGEEYKDSSDATVKYNKIYLVVSNNTYLTETTAYLVNTNVDSDSQYKVNFLSKQAELYNYLTELNK